MKNRPLRYPPTGRDRHVIGIILNKYNRQLEIISYQK